MAKIKSSYTAPKVAKPTFTQPAPKKGTPNKGGKSWKHKL